jgi:hypothetical protein
MSYQMNKTHAEEISPTIAVHFLKTIGTWKIIIGSLRKHSLLNFKKKSLSQATSKLKHTMKTGFANIKKRTKRPLHVSFFLHNSYI